jgi:hypothetical protein
MIAGKAMKRVQVLALFIVIELVAILNTGCVRPKPAEVDPNAPLVWQLPEAARGFDRFCLQGIENPPICRSVADVRRYLASVQAEP